MASQAAKGKVALAEKQYDEAIRLFTLALSESPTSPDYLIQRSTAYQRAQKNTEALADAEQAVINAQKRAKRELITEAQLRRGIVCWQLGRYGDAEFLFNLVKKRDEKNKQVGMWISKTQTKLATETDEEKKKCNVTETPEGGSGEVIAESPKSNGSASTNGAAASTNGTAPAQPAVPEWKQTQQTPADKIRHEWYQNNTNVYFTLLAKGAPHDKTTIDITDRSMSISFPLQTGSSYDLTLDPLFAAVKPGECIKRVLPSKVEVILVKATPGQKWSNLESSEPVAAKTSDATAPEDSAVKSAVLSDTATKGPAYPTSSKHGPKDWDKVTKEASASLRNPDAKPGSAEDDDDFEGGDEANHFFKKLFKGASPEVQRAMMKSYTESNGTALSTNWEEVSKATVKTEPPDGMVANKWES